MGKMEMEVKRKVNIEKKNGKNIKKIFFFLNFLENPV